MMSSKPIKKVLAIYQSEEILILLECGLISQLYDILKKHLHGKQKIKVVM